VFGSPNLIPGRIRALLIAPSSLSPALRWRPARFSQKQAAPLRNDFDGNSIAFQVAQNCGLVHSRRLIDNLRWTMEYGLPPLQTGHERCFIDELDDR
jgi:hypothetical protein